MDKENRVDAFAGELIRLAFDTIIVNMRFMDVALGKLSLKKSRGLSGIACDGAVLYYDPVFLFKL